MNNKGIKMGSLPQQWGGDSVKNITLSITEDCNLACKYCYMTGKNSKNKMTLETAKRVVDYVLENTEMFNEEAVIWDFIGGEPFLEIDLIDKVSDYIKEKMYILNHKWFNNYMFNFSTNGLLYSSPKVQNYIKKNRRHVSIGISVDGNKIKHDLQIVKLDGSGSYDDVIKNVPLWISQFPNSSTKATFSHDDLPYLKDSIISLWDNGIKTVAANVVFEDVWKDGDDIIFENQLKELADYILDNEMWKEYSVRFFDPHIGLPLDKNDLERNFCGAGKMLAVDYKGDFFPCIRFLDFALNNTNGFKIGSIDSGINSDKLRPFVGLSLKNQSSNECINCEVATGCGWCTGANYDCSGDGTIYKRATYNCKMHKANVRANEYFWNEFTKRTGLVSPREDYINSRNTEVKDDKFLYFITEDDIPSHCNYISKTKLNAEKSIMDDNVFYNGLEFASNNNLIPVILGEKNINKHNYINIINNQSKNINENSIVVCENNSDLPVGFNGICILLITKENIKKLLNLVVELSKNVNRINLIIKDVDKWNKSDLELYKNKLDDLVNFVCLTYKNNNPIEINILTDILELSSMCNCDAGKSHISLAPNGKFYICPAFYFDNPKNSIGDLTSGININNEYLLDINNAPICLECDSYHCKRCVFINKKLTGEINTPSKMQCLITHIERKASVKLQQMLNENDDIFFYELNDIDYLDPIEKLQKNGVY
ncbi:radical SAM peptide maturase, CXXX-repeat target family [Clostridium perfringens]